jgi:hypothetical protein
MNLINPPYILVKGVISKDHGRFLYEYQKTRCSAVIELYKNKEVYKHVVQGDFNPAWLSPVLYWLYGDPHFDLLMMNQFETIKEKTGLDIMPMVSLARLYKKDDFLGRHPDRIWDRKLTASVHLGHEGTNDTWPLILQMGEGETYQINLGVGDMLIYLGECDHWRMPCQHSYYGQVMLHYTLRDSVSPDNKPVEIFDGRTHFGVPCPWLVKEKIDAENVWFIDNVLSDTQKVDKHRFLSQE